MDTETSEDTFLPLQGKGISIPIPSRKREENSKREINKECEMDENITKLRKIGSKENISSVEKKPVSILPVSTTAANTTSKELAEPRSSREKGPAPLPPLDARKTSVNAERSNKIKIHEQFRSKSVENKPSISTQLKQTSLKEKRKSAPVKLPITDELKRINCNKEASSEENIRHHVDVSPQNIERKCKNLSLQDKLLSDKYISESHSININPINALKCSISLEDIDRFIIVSENSANNTSQNYASISSNKNNLFDNFVDNIYENDKNKSAIMKLPTSENIFDDSDNNKAKNDCLSTVNISVITSTPLKSDKAPTHSDDNVVVVTGIPAQSSIVPNSTTLQIMSDSVDLSNSLASNVSQVTVVTTHPPVLMDAATNLLSAQHTSSEIVIVANETNKTQLEDEHSGKEESYAKLDCLEFTQSEHPAVIETEQTFSNKTVRKRLDESEVVIVSSVEEEQLLQDTSHVSVVTVGDEPEHVKDSSDHPTHTTKIDEKKTVTNGQVPNNELSIINQQDTRTFNDNTVSSNISELCTHSDSGSGCSQTPSRNIDRSDTDSICTTISQDSHNSNKENNLVETVDKDNFHTRTGSRQHSSEIEEVIYRRKPDYVREIPKRSKEDIEKLHIMNLKKKTRKRTRKFEIDGVVVTTTTSKVIYGDDENGKFYDDQIFRKQELRELKMLQKIEQKQFQDLSQKAQFNKDQQEKRNEQERQILERTAEADLENLIRQQRQQLDRAEAQQESDIRLTSKKIRYEQERELKQFREGLKQDLRLLKQEIDLMPKEIRKNAFKIRKENLEAEHVEREKMFMEKLNESHEISLRRLSDSHREKIVLLERQFLQQKQQLLRARESAIWELEERQIHERHQLLKRQLKDIFFLQRHQMLIKHEKELEQMKRMNQRKEEELIKRQAIERRNLPKRIRNEMKAREMMFRESIRISMSSTQILDPDVERDKLKKFQENEKKRYRAEQQRFELKHARQLEEMRATNDATIKELEQLQNEKRKMLMEHEAIKLKEQEESYSKELREWKNLLKPRKQRLEEQFATQLEEQEFIYNPNALPLSLPTDLPDLTHYTSGSTRSSLSSVSES